VPSQLVLPNHITLALTREAGLVQCESMLLQELCQISQGFGVCEIAPSTARAAWGPDLGRARSSGSRRKRKWAGKGVVGNVACGRIVDSYKGPRQGGRRPLPICWDIVAPSEVARDRMEQSDDAQINEMAFITGQVDCLR
jgi:hypothetical protein